MSHIACKPHNFQASTIDETLLQCPYCHIERLQERVDEWRESTDYWQKEAKKTASELSAEREKYKAVCKDRDEWKESHYQKLVVIAEWMDKVRYMEKKSANDQEDWMECTAEYNKEISRLERELAQLHNAWLDEGAPLPNKAETIRFTDKGGEIK